MTYQQAAEWLLRMDAEHGAYFHLDDVLDEQKYEEESEAREFFFFCEREGFEPYALAMSVMPSFQAAVGEGAN